MKIIIIIIIIIILNISYPSLKGCACSGEEGNGILKGKFGLQNLG